MPENLTVADGKGGMLVNGYLLAVLGFQFVIRRNSTLLTITLTVLSQDQVIQSVLVIRGNSLCVPHC